MSSENIVSCAAAVLLAGAAANGLAQNYPNRPVRLVVPFSPGGAADVPGRILTQKMTEALGQQVVVDNRPGAGSTIGAESVAKAPADGYSLLMISNTHYVSAALYKKLAYDSLTDFAPVTQVTSAPNVIVVHPSLPAKSVKELIALAKAKPGKIDYASSGNGSTQHLTGALFTKMAGIDMMHIPYRGSGPATADAEVLMRLLQVRALTAANEVVPSVIVELRDAKDVQLATIAHADDLIVSDHLASLVIAQLAQTPVLQTIFDQMFDPAGADLEALQYHGRRGLHRDRHRVPEDEARGLVAHRVREGVFAGKAVIRPVREVTEPRGLGLEDVGAFLGARQSHAPVQGFRRDRVDQVGARVRRNHLRRHGQLPVHPAFLGFEQRRLRGGDDAGVGGPRRRRQEKQDGEKCGVTECGEAAEERAASHGLFRQPPAPDVPSNATASLSRAAPRAASRARRPARARTT